MSTPIKIVISDDEPTILKILSDILSKEGYRVTTAKDGLEGLEFCRREHPQLAIFDIVMPRMTGIEACKKIREDRTFDSTAILMLTGMEKESNIVQALEVGADDYVNKPFHSEELIKKIKKLLEYAAAAKLPGVALIRRSQMDMGKKAEG